MTIDHVNGYSKVRCAWDYVEWRKVYYEQYDSSIHKKRIEVPGDETLLHDRYHGDLSELNDHGELPQKTGQGRMPLRERQVQPEAEEQEEQWQKLHKGKREDSRSANAFGMSKWLMWHPALIRLVPGTPPVSDTVPYLVARAVGLDRTLNLSIPEVKTCPEEFIIWLRSRSANIHSLSQWEIYEEIAASTISIGKLN